MWCIYKNANQNGELFFGQVMTSEDDAEAQGYIDIDTYGGGCLEDKIGDWKNNHINCAQTCDVVAVYENLKTLKHYNSIHFI